MFVPCAAALPAWTLMALAAARALPLSEGEGEARSRQPEVLQLGGEAARRVELRANTFTWSAQEAVALAQDQDGSSVVVWHSRRQQAGNYGVYARRISAAGEPVGDEVQVNLYEAGPQTLPSVAIDARGAVWFAWESLGQDGEQGGIFARRFDRELDTSTDEVLVNDITAGNQTQLALACDAAGNALLAWTTPGDEPGARELRARLLGPDGEPRGASFQLSGEGRATLPAIAVHERDFTVVWSASDLAGKPLAIRARRVSAAGEPLGVEHALVSGEGLQPIEPVVDADASGELAAAWLVASADDYEPWFARFSWDAETGTWQSSGAELLSSSAQGGVSGLGLDLLADGRALVAWTRLEKGERPAHIQARWIEPDGTQGEVFELSGEGAARQRLQIGGGARRLVARGDGRIAVAWNGDAASGDGNAANLTLLIPDRVDVGRLAHAEVAAADEIDRFEEAAAPHVPPVSSGGALPRDSFLSSAKSLAGPDFGFVGITQTSLTPPDISLAVGPGHLVEIVNGSIAYFAKDGTLQFQQNIDGGGAFWSSVGANGFIFDPEVNFDPDSRRFMAMACERSGGQAFFLLAVSDDDDPNGTWHKYRFNVTSAASDTDIDSPNMGVDDQAIYLTADFFGPDKYLTYIVEKAPTLVGGVPATTSLLNIGSQSWGVPVMYGTAPAYYMVEAFETFASSTLRLHAVTDPLGTPTDTTFDLAVPSYQTPEDPPQAGTSIRPETFEARIWDCTFRNGKLYVTHHQGNSRVLQRWYEIDMANWPTSGTPTLVQSGTIDPGPGERTFFGSIGVDAAGNIGLTYARSSASTFISMARSYHTPGMAAGTTTPAVDMKGSTGPDTTGRWGDYSRTVPEPDVDSVFWSGHEYRDGGWATWVGTFGPCEAPVVYCTAKTTSTGSTPAIGSVGETSVGLGGFQLTLTGGAPNNIGIYFYGPSTDSSPFFGGTLCVGAPITRSGPFVIDGLGATNAGVPLGIDDLGQDRFYQFWFRDPAQLDGTGVGLSDGLQVFICP